MGSRLDTNSSAVRKRIENRKHGLYLSYLEASSNQLLYR